MRCVYTAQGFEYDWSGVIMGPDLVWRTDRWVPQPGRSFDTQVKRSELADFDRAVRNTYKVLLTRGMIGSVLYSTDPETQNLLAGLVAGSRRLGSQSVTHPLVVDDQVGKASSSNCQTQVTQ